jgi:hypothetical protein
MPDHLTCIGLDYPDKEAFGQLIVEIAEAATPEPGTLGTRALWEDSSGARLAAFWRRDSEIECAKPSFAGTSQIVVRPVGMKDDPDGCRFCAIASVEVLEDGEMLYPLYVELDDIHLGSLRRGRAIPLLITGFAEELTVWPDEAAFQAADTKFAERSLIPSGMFAPGGGARPARAEAILTGVVTKAERRRNERTHMEFDWCTIETLAANMDVVAAPRMQPFEIGNVIQGTFWLIARRADTHPEGAGLWERVVGPLRRN